MADPFRNSTIPRGNRMIVNVCFTENPQIKGKIPAACSSSSTFGTVSVYGSPDAFKSLAHIFVKILLTSFLSLSYRTNYTDPTLPGSVIHYENFNLHVMR